MFTYIGINVFYKSKQIYVAFAHPIGLQMNILARKFVPLLPEHYKRRYSPLSPYRASVCNATASYTVTAHKRRSSSTMNHR